MLRAASPTALVLVDELGKATSSTDGLAFAWAVAEALLATHCLTLFATHFGELSRLGGMYAAASVLHMEALDDGESYKQTHRCVAGPCEVSLYGLKLAKKVRECSLCRAMRIAAGRAMHLSLSPEPDPCMSRCVACSQHEPLARVAAAHAV